MFLTPSFGEGSRERTRHDMRVTNYQLPNPTRHYLVSGRSDKIASKPLNVTKYGLTDKMIILDGVKDSVIQINNETLKTSKTKAQFEFSGEYFKDYFYDNVYMYSKNKGEVTVSKINIDDGTANKIAQLTDIYQPLNIKVINDKVFFTVLDENKFNRIIEVKNKQ